MLERAKTYWREIVKKYPWLDLLWRRLPAAASACTAVAICIAYWRFYLEYYTDKDGWGKVVWYKELIESNIWLNWWLLFYGLLIVFVLIVIALSRKQSIVGWIKLAFVYVSCVICLYSVPALYSVNTVIPHVTYHTLFTVLFGMWIVVALVKIIMQNRTCTCDLIEDKKIKGTQDVQWESYIDATITYLNEQRETDECLAIGIAGPWGSGKTTFMRQMQAKLNADKYIIREFKPWRLSSAVQVNTAFFKLLESVICEAQKWTYEKLLHYVRKYAKLITSVQELPKPAMAIWNHVLPDEEDSIAELHTKINNELNQINKQIIILIDDIDRLDNDEMFEVLRLIRISANFNKITFIVTYDKGYLTQNIFKLLSCKGEDYLKKIINLEIQLPSYEDYVLAEVLCQKIACNFNDEKLLKDLRYAIRKYNTDKGCLINDYLLTFRDAERIANSFTLILMHIRNSSNSIMLNIDDLLWIELLHYFDTLTYNQLKSNYLHLLQSSEHSQERLEIKNASENNHPILEKLFPASFESAELNSIVWQSNIKSYFSYRQLDDKLMLNDFDDFLRSHPTRELAIKRVKRWMKSAKARSFINNLSTYNYLLIDSNETNIAYLDIVLATATYYKYSSVKFQYIVNLFRNLHNDYFFTHHDYLMKKEFFESEMRWFISNYPGLAIWNVLLATMPFCDDKGDPYDESFMDIDQKRKMSLDKIRELASLNFDGFKRNEGIDKLRIDRIFDKNYPLHAFVSASSYLSRCNSAHHNNLSEEVYNNLLPDAITFIFAKRKRYSEKTFEAMMTPLIGHLWIGDESTDTDLARVRHRVEKLFGSVDNFNTFVDDHFTLSKTVIKNYLVSFQLRSLHSEVDRKNGNL